MPESKDRLDFERNPAPPERKRYRDRKQRSSDESVRYDSGYRSSSRNEASGRSRDSRDREDGADEPVPDYSPPRGRRGSPSPSPPPPATRRDDKKAYQKTRFATEAQRRSPARKSVGAAIGNSIRKLVGKIRSASQERRSRSKARSPSPRRVDHSSPTYQQYNVVDSNIPAVGVRNGEAEGRPVQRYYLGEDPFAGSIYGRENKYDNARPHRGDRDRDRDRQPHHVASRTHNGHLSDDEPRTTTLGRFSHSTSRLAHNGNGDDFSRSTQTLPRKLNDDNSKKSRQNGGSKFWNGLTNGKRANSALNVSHQSDSSASGNKSINGYSQGPAKPARSYKALSRSKSFAVGTPENNTPTRSTNMSRNYSTMYKSNPQLSRLSETPEQLKSPGIVSIINRSQRDLANAVSRDEEDRREGRYSKNVTYANGHTTKKYHNGNESDKRDVFLKGLKDRAPDLFHTIHGNDERDYSRSTPSPRHTTPLRNGFSKTVNSSQDYVYKSDPYKRDTGSPYRPLNGNGNLRLKSPELYNGGVLRRGSNSSDNFSETYRYTTKTDDPVRPSITNTVETVSKKTIPSKDGKSKEIIESTEKRSVTTSRYKGEPVSNLKYVENSGRLPGLTTLRRGSLLEERRGSGQNGVNIKVNYRI